jgi:hypothetical protein
MTQDQIIQTLHKVVAENQNFTTWTVSTPHLVGLVNHAIQAEREACAKLCETISNTQANMNAAWRNGCRDAATEIRARGEA